MLIRLLAAAAFALVSVSACAQVGVEPYQAGTHYFPIDPPQPTSSGDKVEVVEVFSYACIHCAHFEPQVQAWKQKMPAAASFSYLPAIFNSSWEIFARAYYAGEVLGIAEKAHQDLFDGVHVRRDVRNLEDIAKVYAKYGKTEQQFLDATKSFGVEMKINRTKQMVPRYGVDGTPTVVVAGKYRVTVGSAGSPEKVFDVVNFLVAKEASAKKVAAAAAAPAKS
ncbi:MAG: thiol:disulfide interchange protein DsbA/DsbL [Rhodanobacteraceae bacterium]|nr:thiol:disulfide interchange protein DsbA/DsbL [Rhodanobacteraceae bacterium]MBL0039568.1 thiol:disulfide interchange protein DsbA/DsbL [Xanthomonadales bacterium]